MIDSHERSETSSRRREVLPAMAGPVVVGIAGGSGSGKTSISDAVCARIGARLVSKITHDSYYKDLAHVSLERRKEVNFDHPDSLDTDLLIEDLRKLKEGQAIGVPVYDFATHTRRPEERQEVQPTPIILLEGILIFSEPRLRDLLDIKVFIDTSSDIRFIRRLKRDTTERGRSAEEVAEQYLSTVRPMHNQFVEPTKQFADVIVPEGGYDSVIAMDMLIAHMKHAVRDAPEAQYDAAGDAVEAEQDATEAGAAEGAEKEQEAK